MKASRRSRTESLSPRLTRWAGLLALAVLPLSAGACIAQTGTPDGSGTGTSDDPKSTPSVGALSGTTATSIGKKPQPPPPSGPVYGPIPSPWLPPEPTTSGDTTSGPVDPTGGGSGGGGGQEPVPSPWMNPGTTTTTSVTN